MDLVVAIANLVWISHFQCIMQATDMVALYLKARIELRGKLCCSYKYQHFRR